MATMPFEPLVRTAMQRYWRMSRSLTLGAQGAVFRADDAVLLIRHTYRPGWHFPGGGVERRETVEAALTRELDEEAGIVLTGPPKLFGVYSNEPVFPGDHVMLYVVRAWEQQRVPPPNHEIAEQGFFHATGLPAGTHPSTRARLVEILQSAKPSAHW